MPHAQTNEALQRIAGMYMFVKCPEKQSPRTASKTNIIVQRTSYCRGKRNECEDCDTGF